MNNNKDGVLSKIASFAEDKGFYIILMLCVAAIGISGYVLFFAGDGGETDLGVLDLNPAISASEDNVPDYTPQIPDVKVELKPEEKPVNAGAEVPVPPVDEKTDEEAWLFKKDPVYQMPVSGEIIRAFSVDALIYDKTMDDWRTHNGIDISCSEGDNVLAIADGKVERVYEDGLLGYVIILAHDDGTKSIYCNLAPNTTMADGMMVAAGDVIAQVGTSMKTESLMEPHLHLSVMRDGEYVNPEDLKFE